MSDPGRLLAQAFFDDPLTAWAEPSKQRRLRTMRTIFNGLLVLARREGSVLETPEGVALWKPPQHFDYSLLDVLRGGLWKVGFVTTPAVLRRFAAHEELAVARVRPFLSPNAGYLAALAVDPSLQGRGHGGRLLNEALAKMRERFSTCVLRTEQPRNVPFYLRHGFKLVDEHVVSVSALPVWVFTRELADVVTS